jgi:hypothetical protein
MQQGNFMTVWIRIVCSKGFMLLKKVGASLILMSMAAKAANRSNFFIPSQQILHC